MDIANKDTIRFPDGTLCSLSYLRKVLRAIEAGDAVIPDADAVDSTHASGDGDDWISLRTLRSLCA